ncbi:uncharacterized protein DC041_0009324 [Schistosoma bovis]|uniref:Uncharacterized protein n=1 Tax=Schistosoma bovis TaxID=6184 RepID=A0A430QUA6_SCHBO|nr:uncharacterized protein DC041_0009324 [Schistosoma bovis]
MLFYCLMSFHQLYEPFLVSFLLLPTCLCIHIQL